MFHEYAAHLTYDHKHGNTQDNIMKATVLSYLSGVMASGKEKFGAENPGFFEVMGGNDSAVDAQNNWYTQMRNGVASEIRQRAIDEGVEEEKEAPAMSRPVLRQISEAYFAVGTIPAMIRRFVLLLLWYGAGRVAECVLTTWNLAEWECLVEQGADKDKANNNGATPLYISAGLGHVAVVRYLMEQGADKDKATNEGWSPLMIARARGHADIVAYLSAAGCT